MAYPPYHPFRSEPARARYLAYYNQRATCWPVPSETRMVETALGSTFVRISGPPGAPPLVLLPGMAATSLMWAPNIAALSAAHRTYAVDNVNDVGRSVFSRPLRSGDDFATWLDDLLAGLRIGSDASVIGVSYGAWVTGQFALCRPERIAKAVLLAPPGLVMPVRWAWIAGALASGMSKSLHHRFLEWVFEDAVRAGGEGVRRIDEMIEEGHLFSECFVPRKPPFPSVLSDEEWSRYRVPTLYLVGEHEKMHSPKSAIARLARIAPRVEAEVVPGAGHDLTIVQADLVHRKVLTFLAKP
jgi:pimeloyl-ACP methyl ester carboxylesterase